MKKVQPDQLSDNDLLTHLEDEELLKSILSDIDELRDTDPIRARKALFRLTDIFIESQETA